MHTQKDARAAAKMPSFQTQTAAALTEYLVPFALPETILGGSLLLFRFRVLHVLEAPQVAVRDVPAGVRISRGQNSVLLGNPDTNGTQARALAVHSNLRRTRR